MHYAREDMNISQTNWRLKKMPKSNVPDHAKIMTLLKTLSDKDEQRSKEIAALKEEQEKSTQNFEMKLATNLMQTNEELAKLKTALGEKESEIESLKSHQRQQEERNKDLSERNKKLEQERQKINGELQLKTSERDEMKLEIKKQKLNQEKVVREKEKLKKNLERQSTVLEQERKEKAMALDGLEREKTVVEQLEKEKDEMQEKIVHLENEMEILTCRPQTARTEWSLSSYRDRTPSPRPPRRQPTGLSQSNDGQSTAMEELMQQKGEIEAEIKRKQIEQKYLKRRLRDLQGATDGFDSKVCSIQ